MTFYCALPEEMPGSYLRGWNKVQKFIEDAYHSMSGVEESSSFKV